MPKINDKSIYPLKLEPKKTDYFIGSDAENNGKTVNFSIDSVIRLINESNNVTAVEYEFSDGSDSEISYLDPGYFNSEDNITNPEQITKLFVNKINRYEQDSTNYFKAISDNKEILSLRLQQPGNPNNFCYFKIEEFLEYDLYLELEVRLVGNVFSENLEDSTIFGFNIDAFEPNTQIVFEGFGVIWKYNGNEEHELEIGDITMRIVENRFMLGRYNGPNKDLFSSYTPFGISTNLNTLPNP